MATSSADREALRAEFRREHQYWSERGVEITTWARDPATGALVVGVRRRRDDVEQMILARYGANTVVAAADVRPA